MRQPILTSVLGVVLGVLGVPGSATAEPVMCQGEAATVVLTDDGVTGETTAGHDVVAVFGAHSVDALGGDDLVCVWGALPATDGGGGTTIRGGPGHDAFAARTSRSPDYLDVRGMESLQIWMGGGYDELRLTNIRGGGRIDAGAGRGLLRMYDFGDVNLDMEDEVLELDGGAGDYVSLRFYDAFATGDRVRLTGERHQNILRAVACQATFAGGRGDDTLRASTASDGGCAPRGARMLGMRGQDLLIGSSLNDVLLGGPDGDRADGRLGVDRCEAERETSCER